MVTKRRNYTKRRKPKTNRRNTRRHTKRRNVKKKNTKKRKISKKSNKILIQEGGMLGCAGCARRSDRAGRGKQPTRVQVKSRNAGYGEVGIAEKRLAHFGYEHDGSNVPRPSQVGTSADAEKERHRRLREANAFDEAMSRARTKENMKTLRSGAHAVGWTSVAQRDAREGIVKNFQEELARKKPKEDPKAVKYLVDRGWDKPK